MNNRFLILICLGLFALISSYFFIPNVILKDTSGGSCYQGISIAINYFFLKIIAILMLIAFVLNLLNKKSLSDLILYVFTWFSVLRIIMLIGNYGFKVFLYVLPFIILTIYYWLYQKNLKIFKGH